MELDTTGISLAHSGSYTCKESAAVVRHLGWEGTTRKRCLGQMDIPDEKKKGINSLSIFHQCFNFKLISTVPVKNLLLRVRTVRWPVALSSDRGRAPLACDWRDANVASTAARVDGEHWLPAATQQGCRAWEAVDRGLEKPSSSSPANHEKAGGAKIGSAMPLRDTINTPASSVNK